MSSPFTPIPIELLRRHRVAPIGENTETFSLGVCTEPEAKMLEDVAFLVGKRVETVEMPAEEVDALLAKHSKADDRKSPVSVKPAPPVTVRSARGSVVHQVDALITSAIIQHASDIHIEPYESSFRVRYRLDGVLHPVEELALNQKEAIISRLKIMAGLDIAEKRRPQDGRIRFAYAGATIDLRVSTLPTDFGEKVVLRILDKSRLSLNLERLGFSTAELEIFRAAIQLPFGMILVTGPTGSGKTTTLYAALQALNQPAVNITTIEDPIEYNLAGINQTHVRADIGLSFAHALRTFLRQDPDVIMVGEMRDAETVEIAVRAALTGHLVLSTLHTNDAPSTIVRLTEMGVKPFLVADSVKLLIAQRLVRKICEGCKIEHTPEDGQVAQLDLCEMPAQLYCGEGCERCNGTGYRGRTALFEIIPVKEEFADLISCQAPIYEVRALARQQGMRSLREVAVEKMLAGTTTLEEVLRETTR